ncbi:hypothetical protein HZH66_004738 [Vespula vulgaris]|uniref:Uncharacterized protein n=1 Tax=Vespula vulgaris TaxID=7454 RepID=A0A834K991_VESVU|nr:hypothetical protein HZH66_004738 [Vespula vulgaris]
MSFTRSPKQNAYSKVRTEPRLQSRSSAVIEFLGPVPSTAGDAGVWLIRCLAGWLAGLSIRDNERLLCCANTNTTIIRTALKLRLSVLNATLCCSDFRSVACKYRHRRRVALSVATTS